MHVLVDRGDKGKGKGKGRGKDRSVVPDALEMLAPAAISDPPRNVPILEGDRVQFADGKAPGAAKAAKPGVSTGEAGKSNLTLQLSGSVGAGVATGPSWTTLNLKSARPSRSAGRSGVKFYGMKVYVEENRSALPGKEGEKQFRRLMESKTLLHLAT